MFIFTITRARKREVSTPSHFSWSISLVKLLRLTSIPALDTAYQINRYNSREQIASYLPHINLQSYRLSGYIKSPKQINCQCSKSSCSSAIYQDSPRCSGCIRIPYIGCSSCSSSRQPFRFLSFSPQRYHPTRNVAGWLHKQVALTGIVLQSSLSPDPAGTPRLAGLLHKHTLIFCFVNFKRSSRRNFPVKHHRELHTCPFF